METERTQPLHLTDLFPFVCHGERPCFNRCCHDVNIYLTPYDILRLRRSLDISTGAFLAEYTLPLFLPAVGHPVAVLKLQGQERRCPFAGEGGCRVYEDRPWSCRSFPQEPIEETPPRFTIVRRDFCKGFEEPFKEPLRTVADWRADEGVGPYERYQALWARVTHHPRFAERDLLRGQARDVFFLGSFNLDEFRSIITTPGFRASFIIAAHRLDAAQDDDGALLELATDWMLTVLFNEPALARKP